MRDNDAVLRALLFAVVVSFGCTERRASRPDAGGLADASTTASAEVPVDAGSELELLERDVAALLTRSCTPCHAWSPQLLVHAQSSCRGGGPVVVPFQAEASPLYRKLAGPPQCGALMPLTGGLPRGAADAVRAWIAAGAPIGGRVSPPVVPDAPARPVEWDPDPN
ncbi:MAG: hypothetical protein JNJ54_29455 [Myxococcaceae bacterium]|nr:hypothetical protein [Myxococcaceae bacterium]